MKCVFKFNEKKEPVCINCGFVGLPTPFPIHQIYRECPIGMQEPGYLEKIANFTKAAAIHAANGLPTCTQEQIDNRLKICLSCEAFKINENNDGGMCMVCGCNCNSNAGYMNKLAWADQECPIGRWKATSGV